jgi:hypothetical protein
MEQKLMVFLIAGILVGAGVGLGIGYFVFSEKGGDTTYWYYIDFNGAEGAGDNGWISASGSDPLDGFTKALDKKGLSYTVDTKSAWISKIGTVSNGAWGLTGGESWMVWLWTSNDLKNTGTWAWQKSDSLNVSIGNVFYVGYTLVNNEMIPSLDPNMKTAWKTSGPLG